MVSTSIYYIIGKVYHDGFAQEPLKHTHANDLGERKHNRHTILRRQTHLYLGYIFTGLGDSIHRSIGATYRPRTHQ